MKDRYDAVLVLGLELNPDDSATPELEARLQTAAEVWRRMGTDCGKIVLCGGVQPGHHTAEADVMAKWLRRVMELRPNINVVYTSTETFTSEFIAAVRQGCSAGRKESACWL